jgi:3-phenylpropionate/trans-cinnamate dioxygenase ferredoxin reductase subunit
VTALPRTAVIIGAGQAGSTLALNLRASGWTGPIRLIGTEASVPYQRPPLSKGYLTGSQDHNDLVLTTAETLSREDIDFRPGLTVERLDTAASEAVLADGSRLPYDVAVLATGSAPRRLNLPGAELRGVHVLRNIGDADELQGGLRAAQHVVIVGGGFVGLEVATAASAAKVTVLEGASRILLRAVSAVVADRVTAEHRARGVEVRTSVGVAALEGEDGRVARVRLADGSAVPADLVLIGVGADAEVSVAEASGLPVEAGIVVDGFLRTSQPNVWAIGDCARYPGAYSDEPVRLESVQNATDQARYLAAALVEGPTGPYRNVPWFWSHQAGVNLQIAGLATPDDDAVVVEDGEHLVVERRRDGRVVAVETLDHPRAHVKARAALAASARPEGVPSA